MDASDVLQDAFIEASRRLDDYAAKPGLPLFLWFRFLAIQVLHAQFRHHIRAQGRDPDREVPIGPGLDSTWGGTVPVAASDGTASRIFHRAEKENRLHDALQQLDPVDREVLLLRDFERLTSGEAAALLGTSEEAVRQRHVRALRKLKALLEKSVHDTPRYFVT